MSGLDNRTQRQKYNEDSVRLFHEFKMLLVMIRGE